MIVQIHASVSGEDIFSDYAYFSSYSGSVSIRKSCD